MAVGDRSVPKSWGAPPAGRKKASTTCRPTMSPAAFIAAAPVPSERFAAGRPRSWMTNALDVVPGATHATAFPSNSSTSATPTIVRDALMPVATPSPAVLREGSSTGVVWSCGQKTACSFPPAARAIPTTSPPSLMASGTAKGRPGSESSARKLRRRQTYGLPPPVRTAICPDALIARPSMLNPLPAPGGSPRSTTEYDGGQSPLAKAGDTAAPIARSAVALRAVGAPISSVAITTPTDATQLSAARSLVDRALRSIALHLRFHLGYEKLRRTVIWTVWPWLTVSGVVSVVWVTLLAVPCGIAGWNGTSEPD